MLSALAELDIDSFLRDYWQQKPLLLRAKAGFDNPLSPQELAGLALEDTVESRIVEEKAGNWQLSNGPFTQQDFDRALPWTLLVQGVDRYIEAVETLKQSIDFLPNWRFDDIMVSYAVDGGSVGPHFDYYDVFLLQGLGQRRWHVGQMCDHNTALRGGTELRILSSFEHSAEYILNAGDVLYLPPGLAHWGIASGDCMTYSLGFRAPRINTLLSRWTDHVLEQLQADTFYADQHALSQSRPGEITAAAVDAARQQVLQALGDNKDPRWFGELATEQNFGVDGLGLSEQLTAEQLQCATRVQLEPDARLAWTESDNKLLVFASGATLETDKFLCDAIQALCSRGILCKSMLSQLLSHDQGKALINALYQLECITVD